MISQRIRFLEAVCYRFQCGQIGPTNQEAYTFLALHLVRDLNEAGKKDVTDGNIGACRVAKHILQPLQEGWLRRRRKNISWCQA